MMIEIIINNRREIIVLKLHNKKELIVQNNKMVHNNQEIKNKIMMIKMVIMEILVEELSHHGLKMIKKKVKE